MSGGSDKDRMKRRVREMKKVFVFVCLFLLFGFLNGAIAERNILPENKTFSAQDFCGVMNKIVDVEFKSGFGKQKVTGRVEYLRPGYVSIDLEGFGQDMSFLFSDVLSVTINEFWQNKDDQEFKKLREAITVE